MFKRLFAEMKTNTNRAKWSIIFSFIENGVMKGQKQDYKEIIRITAWHVLLKLSWNVNREKTENTSLCVSGKYTYSRLAYISKHVSFLNSYICSNKYRWEIHRSQLEELNFSTSKIWCFINDVICRSVWYLIFNNVFNYKKYKKL